MIALKYGDNKSLWHSIKLICIYLILYIAFIPGGAYAIQAAGEINVKSLETLIKNRDFHGLENYLSNQSPEALQDFFGNSANFDRIINAAVETNTTTGTGTEYGALPPEIESAIESIKEWSQYWWFWAIVGGVLLIIIIIILLSGGGGGKSGTDTLPNFPPPPSDGEDDGGGDEPIS